LLEKKEMEISGLFAAGAAVLMFVSALLSLLWFNRVF
jgi:Ca-activated chloride channel family protein